MNKVEFIEALSQKMEVNKKDAEKALSAFVETVKEELAKGERVSLVGFGAFEIAERAARMGRNPKTGDLVQIKASKAPKFKAATALKKSLNEDGE